MEQMEHRELCQKIIESFNGNFETEIEINDKSFFIQKEVFDLINDISFERDNLKTKQN